MLNSSADLKPRTHVRKGRAPVCTCPLMSRARSACDDPEGARHPFVDAARASSEWEAIRPRSAAPPSANLSFTKDALADAGRARSRTSRDPHD